MSSSMGILHIWNTPGCCTTPTVRRRSSNFCSISTSTTVPADIFDRRPLIHSVCLSSKFEIDLGEKYPV